MTDPSAICAVILAAGLSRRMGRLKPLLPLGGRTLLERVAELYRDAGLTDIQVVVGHRADEVRRASTRLQVRWVVNGRYEEGMFTSVVSGLKSLPERCAAFFIHPVDIPLVRPQTVSALIRAYRRKPTGVLYPVFEVERGHPPLISAGLIAEILSWDGGGGLKAFLEGLAGDQVQELPVADEATLLDLDTPEAYRAMAQRFEKRDCPSDAECRALMEKIVGLPEPLIGHCRRVAANAGAILSALRTAGVHLDARLTRAAALLHDIARSEKHHADAGARLLARHGFCALSPIVAAHMDLESPADAPLDEAQIVHLADKLVSGDRTVDMETRFQNKLKKYGKDPESIAAIHRRRENARRILEKVERLTGRCIADILNASDQASG